MKKVLSILIIFITFFIIYFLQANFFSWFNIAGIKPKFNFHTSYPIWPWWYCSKDEYDVFFKEYKRLHEKYKQHLFI